jgi:hypothetical protein
VWRAAILDETTITTQFTSYAIPSALPVKDSPCLVYTSTKVNNTMPQPTIDALDIANTIQPIQSSCVDDD